MKVKNININDIVIGDRYRKNKGNIDSLAKDIAEIGLTNPITIDKDLKLIAGERRLLAMKMNNEKFIPANIISLTEDGDRYKIEFSENENREPFTASEKVEMLKVLTPEHGKHSKHLSGSIEPLKKTTDERRNELAKAVGFSGKNEAKRAQRVQSSTIQQIRDLVDEGKIAISTAAERISKLTEENQQKVVDFINEGGSGKQWRNALYHPIIRMGVQSKNINKDQADGYQDELDSKRKTIKQIKDRITIVGKHQRIGKTNREIIEHHCEVKEAKKEELWDEVQLSKTNYNESARNILNYFGIDSYKTLLGALQYVKKRSKDKPNEN